MRKDGEALERDVFDLEARRKPQVFAPDAVGLWRFNQKLACNKRFSTKLRLPMKRTLQVHTLRACHNLGPRRLRLRSGRQSGQTPVFCSMVAPASPKTE